MPSNKVSIFVPCEEYYGGETVYGFVQLDVQRSFINNGITLVFAAYERTKCEREGELSSKEMHVFLFHKNEFFVDEKVGKGELVPVGLHQLPFAFVLPATLPPTSKLYKGLIEYKLEVKVDIPRATDLHNSLDLHVKGNLFDDVIYASDTKAVSSAEKMKILFRGKIDATATIKKSNYFCGENVLLNVEVNNQSKKPVNAIKAYIERIGTYKANKHTATDKQTYKITIFKECKVTPKSTAKFDLSFHIDDIDLATLVPNSIAPRNVSTTHSIVVVLDIPLYPDLEIRVPLHIMHKKPDRSPCIPAGVVYGANFKPTVLEYVDSSKDKTNKVANFFFKFGCEALDFASNFSD
jgi:hypothetical protein